MTCYSTTIAKTSLLQFPYILPWTTGYLLIITDMETDIIKEHYTYFSILNTQNQCLNILQNELQCFKISENQTKNV